jgi:hypothetical protein
MLEACAHIADVANLITYEDLENIVLVGHSYSAGGVVVRHVRAAAVPLEATERIA